MPIDRAQRRFQESSARARALRDAADGAAPDQARGRRESDRAEEHAPAWAHRQWTPLAHALAVTGDRWTLLIVLELSRGTTRLARLKERLPGISSGVLDHHVHRLAELGLLTRERFREMPPRVELTLTETGRELLPITAGLARWGMRRVWAAPQEGERIDIGALIEMVPMMLAETHELPDGALQLTAVPPGDRFSHLLLFHEGTVRVTDDPDVEATACVEGSQPAWVAALGPARDYAGVKS